MEGSLITVVLTIATAAALIGSMLVASWLAPRFLGRGWFTVHSDTTPYECGSRPFDAVDKHRFSVKFFLVAMLFILFDIEAAFLIPWAVTFKGFAANKAFVLGEMAVFLGILVAGYLYLWWRGALEWE
jgi:NADH:ubiquinone oxidoreductase subunit 3 (subunit A)